MGREGNHMSDQHAPELVVGVQRVFFLYSRAVDEGDLDALCELVTDDVRLTRAEGTREGLDRFLDVYRAHNASPTELSRHVITNVLVDRAADGTVRARAYFEAMLFDPDETRLILGNYSDTLVGESSNLRIAHKRIAVDRVLHLPRATTSWVGAGAAPP